MNRELQTLHSSERSATAAPPRSGEVDGGDSASLLDASSSTDSSSNNTSGKNKLDSVKVKMVDFCKRTKKEYLLAIVIFFVVLVALVVSKPACVHLPGRTGFCFGVAFAIAVAAALAVVIVPLIARSIKK